MAWCEIVEFGKGPCKGCSGKETLVALQSSDISLEDGKVSNDKGDSNTIYEEKDMDKSDNKDQENSDDESVIDENADSSDYFTIPKAMGILDDKYDGPMSPLETATTITPYKHSNTSFGWRAGGESVKYKYSEKGGIVNKGGMSRFFLDQVNQDESILVRNGIVLYIFIV